MFYISDNPDSTVTAESKHIMFPYLAIIVDEWIKYKN